VSVRRWTPARRFRSTAQHHGTTDDRQRFWYSRRYPGRRYGEHVVINMSGDASGYAGLVKWIINITNSRITTSGGLWICRFRIADRPCDAGDSVDNRATDVKHRDDRSSGHGPMHTTAPSSISRASCQTSGDFAYGLVSEGSLFSAHPLPFTTTPFQGILMRAGAY